QNVSPVTCGLLNVSTIVFPCITSKVKVCETVPSGAEKAPQISIVPVGQLYCAGLSSIKPNGGFAQAGSHVISSIYTVPKWAVWPQSVTTNSNVNCWFK